MRASDTWICVSDGERAQFFRCDRRRELEPVMDFGIPHAGAMPFTGRLAGQLDRAARGHLFQHLVLVGPREVLMQLEASIATETRDLLLADMVDLDLSRATPREAVCHLSMVLPN